MVRGALGYPPWGPLSMYSIIYNGTGKGLALKAQKKVTWVITALACALALSTYWSYDNFLAVVYNKLIRVFVAFMPFLHSL